MNIVDLPSLISTEIVDKILLSASRTTSTNYPVTQPQWSWMS